MKIVIIGQWIYPAQTPRAYRTWNLAKELAKQGHKVTVYALLGETNYSQNSVHNLSIKPLSKSRWGCSNSDLKQDYKNQLSRFIYRAIKKLFGYFLDFPDIELFFSTKKAIRSEKQIDLLITIAYPHTIHWGAADCKRKTNIKYWIADCGDPFFSPFSPHPFYFRFVEKYWSDRADAITIPIREAKKGYLPSCHSKIHVVPQGFDFSDVELADYSKNKIPTFAFAGSVFKGTRDPSVFLRFLSTLNEDFKFIVYTNNIELFSKFESLENKIEIHQYIPRKQLLFELSKMDFLVNISNAGSIQAPSKLIDYSLTKRPILSISSAFNEQDLFFDFLHRKYDKQTAPCNLQEYEISHIAKQFVKISQHF